MDVEDVIQYLKDKIGSGEIVCSINDKQVRIDLNSSPEYVGFHIDENKVVIDYYERTAEFNLKDIAEKILDEYKTKEEIDKNLKEIESKYFVVKTKTS